MFQQFLLVLVIQFGLAASALAEPSKPTGEALRQAVSGRTVLLDTPIGSFPIRYKSDGTMTGQAPAFVASPWEPRRTAANGGWPTIVFASVGIDGWTRNNTALSCSALVPPFIGCAMTACPVQQPSARP
jgi:hypothetical protein